MKTTFIKQLFLNLPEHPTTANLSSQVNSHADEISRKQANGRKEPQTAAEALKCYRKKHKSEFISLIENDINAVKILQEFYVLEETVAMKEISSSVFFTKTDIILSTFIQLGMIARLSLKYSDKTSSKTTILES
jgi:hypothetical protein